MGKLSTNKSKVLLDYNKSLLGLDDQYPIGYLAGSTTREAILHDPAYVFKANYSGRIILKGDAVHLLHQLVDSRGNKRVALRQKGF